MSPRKFAHWQFLGSELRALSGRLPKHIQTVINRVIAGMGLLASGKARPDAAKVADAAAKAAPWEALEDTPACARLIKAHFDAVARAERAALEYPHACKQLSKAQFDAAAKAVPWAALEFAHACKRLSDAQFDAAAKAASWQALKYPHACARLVDAQFEDAAKASPAAALFYPHARARTNKLDIDLENLK